VNRSWLVRVLRDPLTVFVVLGALVFAVDAMVGEDDPRIVIDDATLARLADQWRAQAGREPTPEEIEALVGDHVREEILYREALRMGLDRDDVIVRRRLAQKLAFLSEDLTVPDEPAEDALGAYYASHRDRYRLPDRMSFSHVYFSAERRGADAARADAKAELSTLGEPPPDAWRTLGDPFILSRSYAERTVQEVQDLFGREFAETLAGLDTLAEWQGPVASAYGSHLVRIEARIPARDLALDEARDRVRDDYLVDARKSANEAFYRALRERYRVERVTED